VEQTPNDNPDANYGIIPLPNLEAKFIAANTLIGLNEERKDSLDLDDDELKQMKDELWIIRIHKNIRASSWQEKLKLREEDRSLCKEIEKRLIENTAKIDENKIAENKALIEKYKEKIANLPENLRDADEVQMAFFADKPQQKLYKKDINKPKRDELVDKIKRLEAVNTKEGAKGKLTGLEAEIKKMTAWNPYDQNASSPFFDAEWMFGLKTGFDIVIGNPPYVQLQNNGGELANIYEKCNYETFARSGDIYCLFYERGYQLLKPQGKLCYITSNKWMRAGYGENTRKFFSENTNTELLIDFAGVKVFESATVDTNILLFSKENNQQQTKACKVAKESINDLSTFINQNSTNCDFKTNDNWVILSPIEQSIKQKIEAVGTPLKDWDIQINRGVTTGCNEAFVIDEKTKEKLITEDPKSAEIIKPILRGRDIKRYSYEFADLYLITTFPNKKIDIEQYPAIKQYFLNFGYDRLKQTGEKGARKKTNNKWFETQDTTAYWEDFYKEKIAWASVGETYYSFVSEGTFLLDTNYFLTTNGNISYLLGILNSKLVTFWINSEDTPIGDGGAYRHYKYNLEKLSIPDISIDCQQPIIDIVDKILAIKKDTNFSKVQNFGEVEKLEKEIDRLVYGLYGLTESEINCLN
jgi:hypothetical protein